MESPRWQGSTVDLCMMDGISLGSSLLYIGLGGAQQPPMPSLSPKEGPGTNLGEFGAKTRILEGFPSLPTAVRSRRVGP